VAQRNGDPELLQLLVGTAWAKPWMHAATGNQGRLTQLARLDASLIRDPAVLEAAVKNGHVNVVRWLLAQGADPNSRTPHGNATMLHTAAWEGQLEVARL